DADKPYPTDYGWDIRVRHRGAKAIVKIHFFPGDTRSKPVWILQVLGERGGDPGSRETLMTVDSALRALTEISDIGWHARESYGRGHLGTAQAHPIDDGPVDS